MQLVVSQLVFGSATRGTVEILNDRRKVMVMYLSAVFLALKMSADMLQQACMCNLL